MPAAIQGTERCEQACGFFLGDVPAPLAMGMMRGQFKRVSLPLKISVLAKNLKQFCSKKGIAKDLQQFCSQKLMALLP